MRRDLPSADRPSPDREPVPATGDATAVRAASIMAYLVAVAGALGTTVALREGDLVAGFLILTVTLGVAALLAATSTLLRSLRAIERRLELLDRSGPDEAPDSATR